jgi:predicted nucleic acid-binding protein
VKQYIDTSIVVKWFKKEEQHREESLILKHVMTNGSSTFYMSKYRLLELIRALKKAKFPDHIIRESYSTIYEFYLIGILKNVSLEDSFQIAKEAQIELNLYASDALHLAAAIISDCKIIWTEDKHFINCRDKDFILKRKIKIRTLRDLIKEEQDQDQIRS